MRKHFTASTNHDLGSEDIALVSSTSSSTRVSISSGSVSEKIEPSRMDNLGELRLDLRLDRRREVPTGSKSSWEKESNTARSISGSSITEPMLGLRLEARRLSFLEALPREVAITDAPSIVLMSPGKWSSNPAPKSVSEICAHQPKKSLSYIAETTSPSEFSNLRSLKSTGSLMSDNSSLFASCNSFPLSKCSKR